MDMKKITANATVVGGEVESIYLLFTEPMRAKETIHYVRRDDGTHHVLIDVDDSDLPIAMQIVASFGKMKDLGRNGASDEELAAHVSRLFAFANQMVAYHRASQQRRGDGFVEDVIGDARSLPLVATA